MSVENELPKGWVWTRVGEIYDIVGGGTPTTSVEEYWKGDIDWVTSADICGLKDIRPRKQITKDAIENSATNLVPDGSLIVVTRVGLGKVALTKTPLCFSQDAHALIDTSASIYAGYSLYYLAQAVQSFKYQNRGTTIAGVTKKQLSELPFALPPYTEQQRIVSVIEQQFSRLDAGIALLRQAQKKLKLYRASVLKAAVEGELTAQWRTAHPDSEPASELLKRVLAERRAKWEEEQLAKMREKGIVPKDNKWKQAYKEPQEPDVSRLPKLPGGWCWVTVEQVGDIAEQPVLTGPFGSNLGREDFTKSGVPVLTIGCLTDKGLTLEKAFYISQEKATELNRYKLREGDLLFSRMASVGRADIVSKKLEGSIINYHLMRLRLAGSAINSPYFIRYVQGSQSVINYLKDINHGVTRDGINTSQLLALPIALPPLTEQQQIVTLVEERISIINELETTIEKALKQAERQRQSILHQAFTGKLVPQDPNDEPASVLLERIQQERQREQQEKLKTQKVQPKAARSKKAPRMTKAVQIPDGPVEPIDIAGLTQGNLWEQEMNVTTEDQETIEHDLRQNVEA